MIVSEWQWQWVNPWIQHIYAGKLTDEQSTSSSSIPIFNLQDWYWCQLAWGPKPVHQMLVNPSLFRLAHYIPKFILEEFHQWCEDRHHSIFYEFLVRGTGHIKIHGCLFLFWLLHILVSTLVVSGRWGLFYSLNSKLDHKWTVFNTVRKKRQAAR